MTTHTEFFAQSLKAHHDALEATFAAHGDTWAQVASRMAQALGEGHTILFCGNGGSACDAMHIAGEFVGRFVGNRKALPAIALSADSGMLTAIGNDFGFDEVFSRQVEAYGRKGGMLFAMSTSGTSPNVVKALQAARALGMYNVLLTGEKGRHAELPVEAKIVVPSTVTARVQEAHIVLLHTLASLVEREMGLG